MRSRCRWACATARAVTAHRQRGGGIRNLSQECRSLERGRTYALPLVAFGHSQLLRRMGSPLAYEHDQSAAEIELYLGALDDPARFRPNTILTFVNG